MSFFGPGGTGRVQSTTPPSLRPYWPPLPGSWSMGCFPPQLVATILVGRGEASTGRTSRLRRGTGRRWSTGLERDVGCTALDHLVGSPDRAPNERSRAPRPGMEGTRPVGRAYEPAVRGRSRLRPRLQHGRCDNGSPPSPRSGPHQRWRASHPGLGLLVSGSCAFSRQEPTD